MTFQRPVYPDDAWAKLGPALSEQRQQRMQTVAAHRTQHLRVVLQDVHDRHNISACMRSAEAFGIYMFDVIQHVAPKRFRPSDVSRGAKWWMQVRTWQQIPPVALQLKEQGYRLAVGVPDPQATPLHALDLDQPLALVFGNEHEGISPEWDPYIDVKFRIPMVGMMESLNISVAAGITFYELQQRALATLGPKRLYVDAAVQQQLLNEWVCRQTSHYQLRLDRLRGIQPRSEVLRAPECAL